MMIRHWSYIVEFDCSISTANINFILYNRSTKWLIASTHKITLLTAKLTKYMYDSLDGNIDRNLPVVDAQETDGRSTNIAF